MVNKSTNIKKSADMDLWGLVGARMPDRVRSIYESEVLRDGVVSAMLGCAGAIKIAKAPRR